MFPKILTAYTNNEHVYRYRLRENRARSLEIDRFNRGIDASFSRGDFFSNLIKGTREMRSESTTITSEIFSFPPFRVSRRCSCYICSCRKKKKKKYVRHKERWKKEQHAPDICNRRREIVWHHSSLFIIGHRHRVASMHPSIRAILSRHSYASPM